MLKNNYSLLFLTALIFTLPTNFTFAAFEDDYDFVEVRAWGGDDTEEGYHAMQDGDGNVYTTGYFRNTVDFNDAGGTDERTSAGAQDIFLTKYNSDGTYAWTRVMGSTGGDISYRLALADDSVFITGYFSGTVDFDDAGGTDERTSAGSTDIFLTKYNSDGSYAWTRTWGSTSGDTARGVLIVNNLVYVTGYFQGTVDFDDAGGTDERTSAGSTDIFLTKYGLDGTYDSTIAWGSTAGDLGFRLAEYEGAVFVSGYFRNTADFDTSSSTDNHTSIGNTDAFLTKYNADGSYAWTRTWGGTGADSAQEITVGNDGVYATGYFSGTVDFDDAGGTDERTSVGSFDVYLTKYNLDDSYAWTRAWGSTGSDVGWEVKKDGDGILVGGYFQYITDFDGTDGVDEYTPNGDNGGFLTKYNSDGSYAWTQIFSGNLYGNILGVSFLNDTLVLSGNYSGTVNFNPFASSEKTANGITDAFYAKYRVTVPGCTDTTATNFNANADRDNGSCTYRSTTSGGTSAKARVSNLLKQGRVAEAEAIVENNEDILDIDIEEIKEETEKSTIETLQLRLQELLQTFKDLTGRDFSPTPTSNNNTPDQVRDLDIGDTGSDVTALQTILINKNYTIPAGATGYFGTQTQTALSNYQRDNNITPAAGYFGSITRQYLRQTNTEWVWW